MSQVSSNSYTPTLTNSTLVINSMFKDVIPASAGSIPDSYDIYRYLNLVRYSIFDTRYFRRKCNFVYIFRGYLKRLDHKKKIMRHCRENEIPNFFLENATFFEDPIFLSKIRFSPLENPNFFENIQNSGGGGGPLLYTTFRKHTKSGVWSLSEFPCFIVYAARNIPSISDTMWCKAGFIFRTP